MGFKRVFAIYSIALVHMITYMAKQLWYKNIIGRPMPQIEIIRIINDWLTVVDYRCMVAILSVERVFRSVKKNTQLLFSYLFNQNVSNFTLKSFHQFCVSVTHVKQKNGSFHMPTYNAYQSSFEIHLSKINVQYENLYLLQ